LLWLGLALMMRIEPVIGVRPNGVLPGVRPDGDVLLPRASAGARSAGHVFRDCAASGICRLPTIVSVIMLVLLYPLCRWYRTFKAAHPDSFLKYI
jgi:hypothetical protein